MTTEKLFVIDEQGDLTTLYADDLPDLGPIKVTRASNVEYELVPGSGGWDVQLTDETFNGPYAGQVVLNKDQTVLPERAAELAQKGLYRGFKTRAEALATEVAFLQQNTLGRFK